VLIENSIFEDVRLADHVSSVVPVPSGSRERLEETLASGAPLIVYAGTFEAYQGIDLLICAFADVLKARPDVRLLLVGGTPAQIAQKRRLARSVGVDEACLFTGQVSRTRAMDLTSRAHVLVSPRVTGSNTPLKLYEQLASGKPLVATRVASHTQVVSDDVCILVDAEPEPMALGILRAIGNPVDHPHVVNAQSLYQRTYSKPAYEAKVRRLLEIVS
jgi:glycosyltransferase involved in cell wall biosynthesis